MPTVEIYSEMGQLLTCALCCSPREMLPKGDLACSQDLSPHSPHSEPVLPLGMTFPALSTHPPVASRKGAAQSTAHGVMPGCVPVPLVLKIKRGECCGLITFKQNEQQQRKENCTLESISRFTTSLGFCSIRGMILEAFSKGVKPGFVSLFLPIGTFFPSLHQ